jgi:Ca-activated chloride channel family protein
MNDFALQSPQWLFALPLLLLLYLLCLRGVRLSRKAALALGLNPPAMQTSLLLFSLALLLLILALARPGWNPQPKAIAESGRDLIILLDVSRSMLALDRIPNRLENIRASAAQMVETLPPGYRVALVLFAGSSKIVAPPSTDRQFLLKSLAEASPDSVTFGGTRLGDALRKIADSLLNDSNRHGFQDVLVLTDGEDHESDPLSAIPAFNEADASLLLVGLGDALHGMTIPLGDGRYVTFEDEPVVSRQDPTLLQQMATEANTGLYLNAGTREVDLGALYQQFVEQRIGTTTREADFLEYTERSAPLIALSLLLLGMSAWLLRREQGRELAKTLSALTLVAVLIPGSPLQAANAEDLRSSFDSALESAREGRLEEAAEIFSQLSTEASQTQIRAAALTNQASAQLRQALESTEPADPASQLATVREAANLLESALEMDASLLSAARNLEIARHRARFIEALIEAMAEDEDSDGDMETTTSDDALPGESDSMDEDWESDEWDEDADFSDAPPIDADAMLTDFLNQNMPPPSESPQDILDQEMENNQQRQAPRRPRQTGVERDW